MSKDVFNEAYFRGVGSGYKEGYETIRKQVDTFTWPLILSHVPIIPGMRVLDIGCAYGYLLKKFDEVGCETYGVDISKHAIEMARKETRATLYVHDVDKGLPMFSDEYFDLVTMIHVIEHLDSPYNVLREIRRVLKLRGRLVVLTPNLNSLARYLLKILRREYKWYGFTDITHKYLFTLASLKLLVERAGFRVITATAPFMPLKRLSIVSRLGLGGSIFLLAEKE